MNLSEAINARRAVRAYTAQRVDEPTIRSLLQAAVHAPSAMNAQPWAFAIVQDVAQMKRYSDRAKSILLAQAFDSKTHRYEEMLRNEQFNVFYDASTLIVIGATKRGPYTDADCWLAAENLMLAACDAGLGTCCIGFAIPMLNTQEVMEELRMPVGGAAVAPIIVGYPSAMTGPVARAEPRVLSWSRPMAG
jgi:nitroreductase